MRSIGRLLMYPSDPKTELKKPLQSSKTASWSQPISLDDIKKAGKHLDATVNDVLLTVMTGALRRFMEEEGEDINDMLDVRAAIPVNLRPPGASIQMGNRFGLVLLALPVGEARALGRLGLLKQRMNRMKRSAEAVVIYCLLHIVGRTTSWLEDKVVRYLAQKVSVVATNVPGPRERRYLAGSPIRAILPWVPQAGRVGVGVSIFSYAGKVRVGVATDQRVTANPQRIARLFEVEFELLMQEITSLGQSGRYSL